MNEAEEPKPLCIPVADAALGATREEAELAQRAPRLALVVARLAWGAQRSVQRPHKATTRALGASPAHAAVLDRLSLSDAPEAAHAPLTPDERRNLAIYEAARCAALEHCGGRWSSPPHRRRGRRWGCVHGKMA